MGMIINKEELAQRFREMFPIEEGPVRRLKLWTGAGGMDLFNEAMENEGGMERAYTKKVPRFAKVLKWRTSHTGRKYRLLKMSL